MHLPASWPCSSPKPRMPNPSKRLILASRATHMLTTGQILFRAFPLCCIALVARITALDVSEKWAATETICPAHPGDAILLIQSS